ncbi:hypothetical protein MRX96_042651 [Rhipicephalus microplus]
MGSGGPHISSRGKQHKTSQKREETNRAGSRGSAKASNSRDTRSLLYETHIHSALCAEVIQKWVVTHEEARYRETGEKNFSRKDQMGSRSSRKTAAPREPLPYRQELAIRSTASYISRGQS